MGEPAVDPGDGLKQPVLLHRPVQVEGLLRWRVEASEKHVHHDEGLRLPLRVNESVDDLLLV